MNNPVKKREFYNIIKISRLHRGWNQKEMADRIGISVSSYSRIENGFTDVNLSRMVQIADIYELKLTDLLMERGKPETGDTSRDDILQNKLTSQETELLKLRQKIIELYEELYRRPSA